MLHATRECSANLVFTARQDIPEQLWNVDPKETSNGNYERKHVEFVHTGIGIDDKASSDEVQN